MLAVFEVVLAVVILYLLVTQVILPTVNGTPLFPLVRSEPLAEEADKLRASLESSSVAANLAAAADAMKGKAADVKSTLDDLKDKAATVAADVQAAAKDITDKK